MIVPVSCCVSDRDAVMSYVKVPESEGEKLVVTSGDLLRVKEGERSDTVRNCDRLSLNDTVPEKLNVCA